MNVILVPIDSIIPYANNPRNNDHDAVLFVKNCIREFGFQVPIILDKCNVVVCGHTGLKAAIELGMKEVPCTIADDLSEKQIMKYRIVDNATAEIAIWDRVLLSKEMKSFTEIKSEGSEGIEIPQIDKINFEGIDVEIEPQELQSIFTIVFDSKASRDKFQSFLRYAKKVHPELSKEGALLNMLEYEFE